MKLLELGKLLDSIFGLWLFTIHTDGLGLTRVYVFDNINREKLGFKHKTKRVLEIESKSWNKACSFLCKSLREGASVYLEKKQPQKHWYFHR